MSEFKAWFLQPFKKESKSVWRVFALCFLTASIFWVFNSLNKTYTTIVDFPLEIQYDSENYIPVNELPKNTRMEISGFGWDLLKWTLGFGVDPLVIRPENYQVKNQDFGLYRNVIVDRLGQVKLLRLVEDSLEMDFDRRESRNLVFAIDSSTLNFEQGYRLKGDITIVPDSVTLTGPKSILDNLKEVFYIKLPSNSINQEDYDEEVTLEFKSNPLVKLNRNVVNVFFRTERVLKKSINKKIELKNFPQDSITVIPTTVILEYNIIESNFDLIIEDSISVIADYKLLNKLDSVIPLELLNPFSEVESTELNIDSVRIKK